MQSYSDPRWNKNSNSEGSQSMLDSAKIQSFKSYLIHGFNKGNDLIDKIILTADFVEQIPIIGHQVRLLKQRGQGIYDIIRTVRSLKTLLEIYSKGRQLELKLSNEGKILLSKIGFDSLKHLAATLLKTHVGIDVNAGNLSELTGRMAYYLLIQFAPHSENCLLTGSRN